MRYIVAIGFLLFCAFFFVNRYTRSLSTPGAELVESKNDVLLPAGKQWSYDVVLPSTVKPGDVLVYEIRRAVGRIDLGENISRETADAVLKVGAFRIEDASASVRVALQLVDLRDYSPEVEMDNPMRFAGGMNVAGQLAYLKRDPTFFRGSSGGYGGGQSIGWSNDELQLMYFYSGVVDSDFPDGAIDEYTYHVCLSIEAGESEEMPQ